MLASLTQRSERLEAGAPQLERQLLGSEGVARAPENPKAFVMVGAAV
jgi:hypothetical protein